jgi:single-strand DNA-binding protein
MASLNQCNFIGRCGRDPETRFTPSGTAVSNVSIACSEKFKNKAGETEEKTEWINLVFWGKLAEIVSEYVKKGSEIYVSGRMQTEKYTDKDGNERYSTKVNCDKMQMLGAKSGSATGSESAPSGDAPEHGVGDQLDDLDIPF